MVDCFQEKNNSRIMKKHLKSIFVAAILILASCNPKTDQKSKDSYMKILLQSPFGCTHLITLDESGKGEIIAGEDIDLNRESFSFKQIIKRGDIDISGKNDLNMLNEIITSIKDKNLEKSERPKDVSHYELFILGERKIDAYGRESSTFNSIIDIISKNYPFEMDYTCENYIK